MLLKTLYWLAVVAISIALVIALILFLESRDRSSVKNSEAPALTIAA
jgi:nitrogen fixation-related uncharacterized protein